MLRRISRQRLLMGGLILALALAALRFLAVQGWVRPVRVVSGSMAYGLLGEHFLVTCQDCGFPFPYGVESPPRDEKAVCPNCGFASPRTSASQLRVRGDRVLVDRAAFWIDPIQRFDLVAFRDPRQPERLVVKRVLGLPGEMIAIRRGDLYVNDELLRKSLAECHRSAVLVHDHRFRPKSEQRLPARWRSDVANTGWSAHASAFHFVPPKSSSTEPTTAQTDWLMYHHWRCYASPYPRSAEVPVTDNDGYNQAESRELREVVDLLLACQVRQSTSSQALPRRLELRVHSGREWFEWKLDTKARTAVASRRGQPFASAAWPAASDAEPLEIEFGLLDQQLVLAIGNREVIRQPYAIGSEVFRPVSNPVGIGGSQDAFEVSDLQLRRDVYYLDPWGVGQIWELPRRAGDREYLVLGDNPPLSDDSRKWQEPLLSAISILGRVIPLRAAQQ